MNEKLKNLILFNEEAYDKLKKYLIYNVSSVKEIFILVDNITKKYCLPTLFKYLFFLKKSHIIQINTGEEKKNIYTCIKICKEIEIKKGNRESILINLGGGVITDMGGFVASIFKRGIRFINIPTTLLGMVDASVGYKNGINLGSIKNEIGSFYIPKLLIIDINFLKTLHDKEVISGMSEMFKYGLIKDKNFWIDMKKYSLLYIKNKKLDKKIWNYLVKKSIIIKQKIVEKDPKENGLRKILNFGHTIGHALESFFMKKKKIMHGIAVANGMIHESWISYKIDKLSNLDYKEIKSTLLYLYSITYKFSNKEIEKMFEIMQYDKKNKNNKIQFSLLNKIGNCSYNCIVSNSIIKKSFLNF
ncbi:3-dehydroquinate synthase [Blattabacterium cuenoti]|uniref:3-dehydroquinate synthase n=1 Tax=Blattabacterium cuenoti TaxID=1653831 RepID=UPI00163BE6C2|nr:3-dehydroquinate synthase [Blattabacterium cuenoti]